MIAVVQSLSHYSCSLCQAEYQFQKSNVGGKQHDFISQTPDQKKKIDFSIERAN